MDFNPGILSVLVDQSTAGGMASLTSCASSDEAAKLWLRESLLKKWIPDDCGPLEKVAIDGFKTSNALCKLDFDPASLGENADIFRTARSLMYEYFHSAQYQVNTLTLDTCLANGRAGPGSSVATQFTDFFRKMFGGRLSTTEILLYKHYTGHISPRWRQAELVRSAAYQVDVVQGSKLSTVPKNAKTNRTICTEPSLNMFYQLGAGEVIQQLLLKFHNISIRRDETRELEEQPTVNSFLARKGSIDGSLATIDLSSASDTIATGLVRYLLPEGAFNTLNFLRSKKTFYGDEEIELRMFSSMGNGFTFPLQTMIFATLVRATYLELGIKPRTRGMDRNYSVFGDDIICLSGAYDRVCRVLTDAGFSVNSEKSYADGPFRESCGHDYFNGYNIRGVYVKQAKTYQDIYSIFNRLARWSARHRIDLTPALCYLYELAPKRHVPLDEDDVAGFKVPRRLAQPRTCLSKKFNCITDCYTAYSPRQKTYTIRNGVDNPWGALIGALGGYIRYNKILPRTTGPVSYKIVRRTTSSWDFVPHVGLTSQDFLITLLGVIP